MLNSHSLMNFITSYGIFAFFSKLYLLLVAVVAVWLIELVSKQSSTDTPTIFKFFYLRLDILFNTTRSIDFMRINKKKVTNQFYYIFFILFSRFKYVFNWLITFWWFDETDFLFYQFQFFKIHSFYLKCVCDIEKLFLTKAKNTFFKTRFIWNKFKNLRILIYGENWREKNC